MVLMRSVEMSMLSSMESTERSSVWSSFWMCRMSLARASPRRRRMPLTNSSTSSSPSPSSRISHSSSMSLGMMSSARSFCRTFRCLEALKSSAWEILPLLSSSINSKKAWSSSSSFSFSCSSLTARSCSSALPFEKACSTMMAVTRFISTKTAMEMNTTKKRTTQICTFMRSRTSADHESRVITWKRLSMDRSTSPKYSCAVTLSLKASCLPISDVAMIAKKYRTQPIMT
mmetsp:Transcript_43523/g.135406  ORF Transcript_43523/g.135406 Transcript_43523/m.135406 type:complete len:230 (-) Transcript_43523:631-1320(-)